jgi:uncharacterized SAM-binding protein YcdF (DUF218 family)
MPGSEHGANQPTEREIDAQALIIWNYHLMGHHLQISDCLLALGSNDPRVAEYAAELYLAGWAPRLIFSGGVGALTAGLYGCSEAEFFARIAIDLGVPEDRILVEPRSTNTGENVALTRTLLDRQKLAVQRVILVQKPFMERRAYATFKRVWPEPELIVTSPLVGFSDYPTDTLPNQDVINVMVGDLQRIRLYPARGFQIPQAIPDPVWAAFEKLVEWGYTRHLAEPPNRI